PTDSLTIKLFGMLDTDDDGPGAQTRLLAYDVDVVLTSNADQIWLRVTDGDGKTLVETVLARGESWTVPADAKEPKLRTARPDALQISVGGKALPLLSDKPETVSGVLLTPAALQGQGAAPAPAAPASTPAPGTTPVAAPTAPVRTPAPAVTPARRSTPPSSPRPRASSSADRPASAVPSASGTPESLLPPSVTSAAVSTTSN
ncbi:DUF4115 domain-containing protein, partial [Novosphingobium profundi]|uniref:DUF4115 domain-containing protein n=1 Tax=Novosphingobium profundi TaxID=1774954 RepID=UPI001BD9532D